MVGTSKASVTCSTWISTFAVMPTRSASFSAPVSDSGTAYTITSPCSAPCSGHRQHFAREALPREGVERDHGILSFAHLPDRRLVHRCHYLHGLQIRQRQDRCVRRHLVALADVGLQNCAVEGRHQLRARQRGLGVAHRQPLLVHRRLRRRDLSRIRACVQLLPRFLRRLEIHLGLVHGDLGLRQGELVAAGLCIRQRFLRIGQGCLGVRGGSSAPGGRRIGCSTGS